MSGDRIYHGSPCRNCGLTEKYRSNKGCVHCKRLRNIRRRGDPNSRGTSDHRYSVWLRWKYGLTLLEYRAMLERQGGVCAICKTDVCATGKRFAVDHCHKSKRNRGVLCKSCNVALGELKDSPALLRRAAEYLEESVDV